MDLALALPDGKLTFIQYHSVLLRMVCAMSAHHFSQDNVCVTTCRIGSGRFPRKKVAPWTSVLATWGGQRVVPGCTLHLDSHGGISARALKAVNNRSHMTWRDMNIQPFNSGLQHSGRDIENQRFLSWRHLCDPGALQKTYVWSGVISECIAGACLRTCFCWEISFWFWVNEHICVVWSKSSRSHATLMYFCDMAMSRSGRNTNWKSEVYHLSH